MPLLNENSFQRLSDDIIEPAENLTLSILERIKKIARRLIGNPTQPISQEQIERELAEQWEVFFREAKNWTDQAMPNAYLRGIQKTNAQIPTGTEARFGVPPTIELAGAAGISGSGGDISATAKEILSDYPKHHNIYTAFQDAAYNKFSQTRLPVIRDTKGKVRDLIIQASEESYKTADGFTRRKMSQNLMNKFADDNITGIQYRDGRTMKLDTYSEMVARSQTGNAARQSSINRLQQHGLDLVQISQHFPTSDLCRPWQARVYSVSGTSDRYPPLSEATSSGLYHPNCLHFQSAYIDGVSELPDEEMSVKRNRKQYEATQRQRTIERRIRKYKRREASALTDQARQDAKGKIRQWQKAQRNHVDEWSHLRRKYQRESV